MSSTLLVMLLTIPQATLLQIYPVINCLLRWLVILYYCNSFKRLYAKLVTFFGKKKKVLFSGENKTLLCSGNPERYEQILPLRKEMLKTVSRSCCLQVFRNKIISRSINSNTGALLGILKNF